LKATTCWQAKGLWGVQPTCTKDAFELLELRQFMFVRGTLPESTPFQYLRPYQANDGIFQRDLTG
jgi:hypothetical protein